MTKPRAGRANLPEKIYEVGELNAEVQDLLETEYETVAVEGEVSGWVRAASGHCYFDLKDEEATLRCVLFRSFATRLGFEPADGVCAIAVGRLTLYPARGQYQLRVERLVPGGEGELQKAFEALKARLLAEGLFADERKRSIPEFPRTIGIVTSPTGAAVRDVIRIARSRWPGIEFLLSPVRVQGEGAAAEIAAGITAQARWNRADVLIVGRGGGSIEDLWAFNEEVVVRAVAESPIPVISAVGHESDVTLSDLAADVRASTPSRAAELAVPEQREVGRLLRDLGARLVNAQSSAIERRRQRIRQIARSHGLHRPRTIVEGAMQRLDELTARWRLTATLITSRHRPVLAELGGKLRALDPTQVLSRGYAICATEDGRLIREGGALASGDRLTLRFHQGGAHCRVDDAWAAPPKGES